MVRHKAPKGYFQTDYPLYHQGSVSFSLTAEDETKNSTIVPLAFHDEVGSAGSVENVIVNPNHANFLEQASSECYTNSIIPRMNLSFDVGMSKLAIETDKLRALTFSFMPIYMRFKSNYDAADADAGATVESILEMEYVEASEQAHPLYTTVDLLGATLLDAGQLGLDTDQLIESVAFDADAYFDKKFMSNGDLIHASAPKFTTRTVYRDKPFRYRTSPRQFMHPRVKRVVPYMFCGMLFHMDQAGSQRQLVRAADTTVIAHLDFNVNWSFEEWNSTFDQSSS